MRVLVTIVTAVVALLGLWAGPAADHLADAWFASEPATVLRLADQLAVAKIGRAHV